MLFCQNLVQKDEVRKMFGPNAKGLWINYLSGTLDNMHVIDMIIGTDGNTCKGFYILRQSGAKFYFEGEEINQKLTLMELNQNSKLTGLISAHYDGSNFSGHWANVDKSQKLSLNLNYVKSFREFGMTQCHQKQWQKNYQGKINNKNISLGISKFDNQYNVSFWDNEFYSKSFEIEEIGPLLKLEINIPNTVFHDKWIMIDTSSFQKLDVWNRNEQGSLILNQFNSEAFLSFDCFEYADYHSRIECIKPVTGKNKFDLWIENQFKNWISSSRKKVSLIKTEDVGTYDRWVQLNSGWVEVDLYRNDIISGTIYMQNTSKSKTEKKSFIYDLKSGKEVKIQDYFEQNFDCDAYFDSVIPKIRNDLICIPEIKEWVQSQNFNYITLTEQGLSFKTDYSTIYGEKEILISYKEMENMLKSKSIIKDLLSR